MKVAQQLGEVFSFDSPAIPSAEDFEVCCYCIGHAIYSLDAVKQVIKVSTKTLLEEPRAELTALHTLLLLVQTQFADQVLLILLTPSSHSSLTAVFQL